MSEGRPRRRWARRVVAVAMAGLLAAAIEAHEPAPPLPAGDANGHSTGAAGGGPARPVAGPARLDAARPGGAALRSDPAPRMAVPDIPDVPDTVAVREVDLLVHLPDGAGTEALWRSVRIPGVERVAGLALFDVVLVGGKQDPRPVRAVAADPLALRPMTPAVTANAPGVWRRLLEGDIAVRHDVAHHQGLDLGSRAELHGDRQVGVRVGAFASNGAPPLGDLVLPWEVAEALGHNAVGTLAVAVSPGAGREAVGRRIVSALGGGEVVLRRQPRERLARLPAQGIQPFSYTDFGDGMISIDPSWVRRWIVRVQLPILGEAHCHRIMVPQLVAALEEIRRKGLGNLLHPEQFAGCWMPRHIDWDPRKPISMHAWGLAVDVNSHDNWIGRRPQLDMRIVEVFERWGFAWGGRWARPDGMHFELRRLVTE